jgi:hypothetical protein
VRVKGGDSVCAPRGRYCVFVDAVIFKHFLRKLSEAYSFGLQASKLSRSGGEEDVRRSRLRFVSEHGLEAQAKN